MNTHPSTPLLLVSVERIKQIFEAHDPDYGRDLTEAEWEDIALRIEQLTRLVVSMGERLELTKRKEAKKSAA